MSLIFKLDTPHFAPVTVLLDAHLALMRSLSPPESTHALDHSELAADDVKLWSVWRNEDLVGVCALKTLGPKHGEIKSMHTKINRRGAGYGRQMLEHVLQEGRAAGFERLSLETGSQDGFAPARGLYEAAGFTYCDPFAGYKRDPNSVFMTMLI